MNVDEGKRFRNFVVGSSNQRAVECIQRSFRTRGVLTPIVLLGPSGVGKSHLLQAVANRLRVRGRRVLAVRAHEFRERYVASIWAGTTHEFRTDMRAHDALVVDEVDDLLTYDSVLAELSQVVRDFVEHKRRMYLATAKLWPNLLNELAEWDATILPIGLPSLAQRKAAMIKQGRRRLASRELTEIARSAPTIGEALAALERELLANELADASAVPA